MNIFGRVTERGIFHTEIQTPDRDLMTIPNLFLVSQPVKVVRKSGTIISATLSLGYDAPIATVEPLLLAAAEKAALAEAFVHVTALGNFAVEYRVAGFLADVEHLVTARSTLHRSVLDTLHGAGIEIVSPTFMNQRALDAKRPVIAPTAGASETVLPEQEAAPERVMFDKAVAAARGETLRGEIEEIAKTIKSLGGEAKGADDDSKKKIQARIAELEGRRERLEHLLATGEKRDTQAEHHIQTAAETQASMSEPEGPSR